MTSRSARLIACVLPACLALAVAGCGGGGEQGRALGAPPPPGQNFTPDDLDRFIAKRSDLPSGYERRRRLSGSRRDFVEPAQTREERSLLQNVVAPGLRSFKSVAYRKKAGENSNTPGSFALLYDTPAAASKALGAVRKLLIDSFVVTGGFDEEPPQKVRVSGLGDEAPPGVKLALGPYAFYAYVWRVRNIVASLAGGDTLGDMSGRSILETAKRIDFRATR